MKAIEKAKISQSFKKGYNQVQRKDIYKIKGEIMEALKVTSDPAWLRRLRGEVSPKVDEVLAIEEVFKKYGIIDVWGEN